MIGAIQKHSSTKTAKKAQLPYQCAIFNAAVPLYKRKFDCFHNYRVELETTRPVEGAGDRRKWLHVDASSLTPNVFARNVLGSVTQTFQAKVSLSPVEFIYLAASSCLFI